MFAGGFGGDEDGVDLRENLRIVEGHRPPALTFIFLVENAQAMGYFHHAGLSTPDMKDDIRFHPLRIFQIVRVKDERFTFDIKYAPKRKLSLPIGICIVHIDDVQVPGGHKLSHFSYGRL